MTLSNPPSLKVSRGPNNAGSPTRRANAPEPTSPRGSGAQIAEKQKLSVIKPGHWRNKWRAAAWKRTNPEVTYLDDQTILAAARWPSSEIAEQKALEVKAAGKLKSASYLGPVFFPSDDP